MSSPGRYNFRDCVPEGRITVASIEPNQLIRGNFNFVVNTPPKAESLLDNGNPFDARKIVRGYDGVLLDDQGKVIGEVNTWSCELDFQNARHQPPGQRHEQAVPMSFSCTLSFTAVRVRDSFLLQKLLDSIQPVDESQTVQDVSFNFQGLIKSRG